jgi:hypothetical protein
MVPTPGITTRSFGRHNTQYLRRCRNQSNIDHLVWEFWDFGLNRREFARKMGVHPLRVAFWIRYISFDRLSLQSAVQIAKLILSQLHSIEKVARESGRLRGAYKGLRHQLASPRLPRILLANAIRYTFGQWEAPVRYDGERIGPIILGSSTGCSRATRRPSGEPQ